MLIEPLLRGRRFPVEKALNGSKLESEQPLQSFIEHLESNPYAYVYMNFIFV